MEETTTKKATKIVPILIALILFLALSAGAYLFGKNSSQPESSPTPTTIASPTIIPSLSPLSSPKISPTATATVVATATATPTPTATTTSTPTPEPKADLYISEYSFNHDPVMGEPFTVKIGIYNKGNKAATGFYWEWWPAASSAHCRERIDSLAARGGRIVYCTYTYAGWTGGSGYPSKAVADVDNEVVESDETNNTYTKNVLVIH